MTATKTTPKFNPILATYLSTARQAGCPPDQLLNFRRGGYVAQPKQLAFSAAARECDEPGGPTQVGFGGSRGPGKSHCVFAQAALDDCQRVPGLKVLYLRKIGRQAREQFEDLRRAVLNNTPHKYNRSEGVVYFLNGSRILIGHFQNEADIDNYLGIQYDLIVIEESTTLTQTKRQAVRDSNRSSIPGWRPRIYETTNPGGVGHAWFKATYIIPAREGNETDTRFIFATVDDNRFIDSDYKRKLEQNTGWRLRAYRYGDWDIAAGQFFTTFDYNIHVIKPFKIPADWLNWGSLDYGFVHPTAAYLHTINEDTIYTIAEHWRQRAQVSTHAAALKAMQARLEVSARVWRAGSDVFAKKDDGPTIADKYQKEGIKLSPANSDRINGAAEMLARLGDPANGIPARWFIFDTCPRLIECLPILQHDPHRPEDVLKWDIDEAGDGGDDSYDAARYGLMHIERKAEFTESNPFYS